MVSVIIYCRISTEKKDSKIKTHDNTSLTTQLQVCKDYCRRSGYKVEDIVYEVGSAYTRVPHKLDYLIIPENAGKRIVIYAIDRFSRNTDFGFRLLKEAKEFGIILEFVSDGFTTEKDRHILQIKAEILRAEHESRIIGVRMRDRNNAKRKHGWAFGGRAKYGYEFKMVNGVRKLVEVPQEQVVIDFINYAATDGFILKELNRLLMKMNPNEKCKIEIFDTKGNIVEDTNCIQAQTNRDIANLLNSYNISYREKGNWTTSNVRRILARSCVNLDSFMRKVKL
jgi:DNA invertase Pin-like site-specific DNA recombinase